MTVVSIDCRFAATNTGLGRYTRSLVAALLERNDPWEYALFVGSHREPWIDALPSAAPTVIVDARHYTAAEHLALRKAIGDVGASLHFSPHFNAPLLSPVPTVVTIHDLILHRYPNRRSLFAQLAYRLLFGRAVRDARAILSVSSFVANELLHRYGAPIAAKTTVVGEGVDAHFVRAESDAIAALRAKYALPNEFFVYVGNAKQHKNVPLLLAAYASLPRPAPALVLVTGGPEAKRLRLPDDCRILPAIDDADLPVLYSAARCLVTASLYEGFGLPIVEALACGCPVIAAKTSSIPETAKGHAMLLAPTVEAFREALLHPPERKAPVRLWAWEEAAASTAAVLRTALRAS